MIPLGVAGFGVALYAALDGLKAEAAPLETVAANADCPVRAAGFTAALAATSWGVEWWLDAGFYGTFVGDLLIVGLGRLLGDAVERALEHARTTT